LIWATLGIIFISIAFVAALLVMLLVNVLLTLLIVILLVTGVLPAGIGSVALEWRWLASVLVIVKVKVHPMAVVFALVIVSRLLGLLTLVTVGELLEAIIGRPIYGLVLSLGFIAVVGLFATFKLAEVRVIAIKSLAIELLNRLIAREGRLGILLVTRL